MTPRNSLNLESNSSGSIIWHGECVPCLGIKPGDNLNIVVYNIATKVCELTSPLDLSTLSLQCALDLFNKDEVGNRTLNKVLQLLIDNECSLKELIDTLQNSIENIPDGTVSLNLECLGDIGIYTNEDAFQIIVNNICEVKEDIVTLNGKITTLKNQVDNLDIPSGEEATVTLCVNNTLKPVSAALEDLSDDYCEQKTAIGDENLIALAISKQSSIFNTLMSSVTGWNNSPATLAQSVGNMWLVLNNYAGRIAANEECCAGGCEDIKVGFITSFEGTSVILQFTSGAGTFIPTGYEDCGSVLTITDSLGVSFSVPISVSQGGETSEIDLSLFKKGEVLDFNIDLKLCSEGETCEKCINKSVKYINDGCCILTNNSGEEVTLVYEVPVNSIIT